MLNFSRLKIFLISLLSLVAVVFAIPSFLINSSNESVLRLKQYLPNSQVNLGLDLRGGSQILLQVDNEAYFGDQLNITAESLKDEFYREGIRALPEKTGNKITFSIADSKKVKEAKALISKLNDNLEIDESNGEFELFFSDSSQKRMRHDLVMQSIEIVRRRIDENGTKEPTIIAEGEDRILLQVPGVENSAELKNLLGKTAKMAFHFVAQNSEENFLKSDFMQSYDSQGRIYLIERKIMLGGELLTAANPTYFEGRPAVAFRFNSLGSRKFSDITTNNIGKAFAIILDGKVITAPVINTPINEGSGVISGNFSPKEATELALLLRAGALPAPLKVIEERTVGPSLGSDSITNGGIALFAGIALIAGFMLLFYGIFGFFANIAMLINVAIIIALLSFLGATLTLPGIAGIVLTMGMAVDSNVLIFERIKEELREKKSIFASIEEGFKQAYRTIIDSNLTTLITAFFLYAFGSGTVKGFAVTLSIGILASMFSSILLTRMIIAIWLKNFRPKQLSLV